MIDDAFTERKGMEDFEGLENLSDDQEITTEPKEHSIPKSSYSPKDMDILDTNQPSIDKSKSLREPSSRVKSNHPKVNIIGDLDERMRLHKRVLNSLIYISYVSQIEPKKVEEAL